MNKYTKQLRDELNACESLPIFEVEVIDTNGEVGFISCNIYFKGNSIIAEREAVNQKEAKSSLIAMNKLVVDDCFSLDEHLQDLHEEVIRSILDGELYTLVN